MTNLEKAVRKSLAGQVQDAESLEKGVKAMLELAKLLVRIEHDRLNGRKQVWLDARDGKLQHVYVSKPTKVA